MNTPEQKQPMKPAKPHVQGTHGRESVINSLKGSSHQTGGSFGRTSGAIDSLKAKKSGA